MALKPSDMGKPNAEDVRRVDELEHLIDEKIRGANPGSDKIWLSLNGSKPCLKGKSLTPGQLFELRRRYAEWEVEVRSDQREGSSIYLKP